MAKQLNFDGHAKKSLLPLAFVFLVTAVMTGLLTTGIVMPAYFGIDPFGWGAALNLISPTTPATANHLPATPVLDADSQAQSAAVIANQPDDPLSVRTDTVELTLPAKQSLDYRLAMERDYELDYHWKADNPQLYMELRGESKDGSIPGKTFGKLSGAAGKGYFITPFEGQFGWHWKNKSDQPVIIKLTTKGHYQVVGQSAYSLLK